MIGRRSFLAGILAAGAAPAIARAESLMKVAAPRVWTQPWTLILQPDLRRAWDDALRGVATGGQGWVTMGVDVATPGGDITAIALRTGEIGRIDSEIRFIEAPLLPADRYAMQAALNREYREFLERLPVSRSDFLGEVLQREVDLSPKPPRFSADSVVRKRYRW